MQRKLGRGASARDLRHPRLHRRKAAERRRLQLGEREKVVNVLSPILHLIEGLETSSMLFLQPREVAVVRDSEADFY
jgi:hypothetical protein